MEEEKKLVVARPKESLPFGMKIREAAHKAAFGGEKRGVLQRYATFFQKKKKMRVAQLVVSFEFPRRAQPLRVVRCAVVGDHSLSLIHI